MLCYARDGDVGHLFILYLFLLTAVVFSEYMRYWYCYCMLYVQFEDPSKSVVVVFGVTPDFFSSVVF